MYDRGRRYRKPDLLAVLTVVVGLGFTISLLLPYLPG